MIYRALFNLIVQLSCFIIIIILNVFIVVLGGGTLWHLQKFLQYINYIIFEFTSPPFSFIPLSPHPPLLIHQKHHDFITSSEH
jgi:hypothetical protein